MAARLCHLLLLALLLPAAAAGQRAPDAVAARWTGPDGPLPFDTEEQLLSFLATARIVSQKELTGGINRPLKVRLEQDGVAANAIFRIVDIERKRARLDGKFIPDFHDSYIYECAAYEMSRLLGIANVPPCIPRRYEYIDGTMQLWVEDAMTEKQRRDAGRKPPEQLRWLRQKQTMRLFDALIYNFDRNQGNMLIDRNWKLWFIDHTRSFRKSAAVENPGKIIWCERGVWEKLRALDKKQLSPLKRLVSPLRLNLLLKRRDKLVAHLEARIEEKGEDGVLYDAAEAREVSAEELTVLERDDDIPLTSSQLEDG